MGMFQANEKKSSANRALVCKAIETAAQDGADYTAVYGYFMKKGLMFQRMYNYAIGFQTGTKKLLFVPLDGDGAVAGDAIVLEAGDISGAKKTLQGGVRISSPRLEKPLEVTVPGFVPDSGEGAGQLAINQQEEAAAFATLIKEF